MRTLILYGSRRGATAACAKLVAEALGTHPTVVDASIVQEFDFTPYDTIDASFVATWAKSLRLV